MSFVDSSDRLQPFFYNLGHAPSPPLCQKWKCNSLPCYNAYKLL
jgi:hypothetical protein